MASKIRLKTSHRKPKPQRKNKHIGSKFETWLDEEKIARVPPPKKRRK